MTKTNDVYQDMKMKIYTEGSTLNLANIIIGDRNDECYITTENKIKKKIKKKKLINETEILYID